METKFIEKVAKLVKAANQNVGWTSILVDWREVRGLVEMLETFGFGLIQVDNQSKTLDGEMVDRITIFDVARWERLNIDRGIPASVDREIPVGAVRVDQDNNGDGMIYYLVPTLVEEQTAQQLAAEGRMTARQWFELFGTDDVGRFEQAETLQSGIQKEWSYKVTLEEALPRLEQERFRALRWDWAVEVIKQQMDAADLEAPVRPDVWLPEWVKWGETGPSDSHKFKLGTHKDCVLWLLQSDKIVYVEFLRRYTVRRMR